MAVAQLQNRIGATEYNSVTSMTQAPTSAFTSGSLIVVNTASWKEGTDQNIGTVSDPVNGNYTQAVAAPRIDSATILYQYYKANNASTAASTITVTWSVGSSGGLTILEYSGVKTVPTVVTGSTSSAASTTMSSGSANATASSVYVAAGSYNQGGPTTISNTPGGGFVFVHEFDENNDTQDLAVAEQLNVSGAQTCTWTLGSACSWTGCVAAYEAAVASETVTVDKWFQETKHARPREVVVVSY